MQVNKTKTNDSALSGNCLKPLLANRLLKFRAWSKNIDEHFMAIQGEPDLETLQSFMFHYSDQPIIMQFTGFYDFNKKEIFEGDIIKTLNNMVFVFFGKHLSYVTMLGKKDTIETNGWLVINAKAHIDVLDESFCNGEVIGNIYENPELLDGSTVA